jgi:peptidoglycan hydrolase-like protein with peptidoglycan-binding domain
MLLTGKIVWSGIVFLLVTTGFSGPRAAAPRAATNLIQEAPTLQHQNDAKSAQQALYDRGHYSGKVDGAFGLRTRASIRAYQKAENLPITGQVDAHTAAGLGVRPESTWGTSPSGGREVGHRNKPSAGIRLTKRRTSKGQSRQVAQERNAIDADGGNADNK